MPNLTGKNVLNQYICVVRFNGLVDHNNANSIQQAQNTSLYLTSLGLKFVYMKYTKIGKLGLHIGTQCLKHCIRT